MRRRWKSITALCMSAMIGCILPGSTMLAAEEDAEAVESVQETENSELPESERQETEVSESAEDEQPETEISESTEGEQQETESSEATESEQQETESSESVEDEQPETESPESAEGEQAENEISESSEEEQPETVDSIVAPQVMKTAAASEVQEQAEKAAPVIAIRLQGTDRVQALGGKIEYDTYVGNHDQRLSVSASNAIALSYYLDTAANTADESKSEEQLTGLWTAADQVSGQEVSLGQDGKYVLYVKAESADGQVVYARTGGIVIDATAPVIVGIDNGGTYPEGTSFGVTDDNLESVLINEQSAAPSADGTYQVAAAAYSSSCVIRAKDKAGNETVYSITVQEKKPEEDTTVILESGTYSLKAGTAYRLGSGTWTLEGDGTVYRGGSTFYVRADGSYQFKWR